MIPMLRNLLSGACLAIKPLYIFHLSYYISHKTNGKCLYASSPSVCTSSLHCRLPGIVARSKGRAALRPRHYPLPAIMRERFIGLSHSMHVLALLDSVPLARRGVHNFGGEFIDHGLLATVARVSHQPTHRQGDAAGGVDLDRDLIVGASDALRFDFDLRLKVVERFLEDLQRVFLRTLLDLVKSLINDALGHRLLAVPHHRVDELGDERAIVNRVGQNLAFWDFSSSRHKLTSQSVEPLGAARGADPGLFLLAPLGGRAGRALFRSLRAVLRAALLAVSHADRIERAAHDVIANSRQVLHAPAAHQHDRVLLQVVPDARDVRGNLDPVGQTHARYLAQGRVRLLRRLSLHLHAHASALRAGLKRRA